MSNQESADASSAAINDASFRRAANQDLRAVLDAVYEADPAARPGEDLVAAAAARLDRLRG